jgi:N,N'-diacetyllegionaminate synthase
MRTKICAELATGHGGNVDVALHMIDAAAKAGCDAVKVQHYGEIHPNDPQAAWLAQSRLSLSEHAILRDSARQQQMEFWATPFNVAALSDLVDLSVDRVKIASTEAARDWWHSKVPKQLVVSLPWGEVPPRLPVALHLVAIPLYPTPLEVVGRVSLLDCEDRPRGWSDHVVGNSACLYMIARHASWIEAHLTLGEGKSRVMPFDKTPEDFKRLREFAESVETMRSGIGATFRNRWTA